MNTQLNQVRNFMIAFSQITRSEPVTELSESEKFLRLKLIQEELNELCAAFYTDAYSYGYNKTSTGYATDTTRVNPVKALDALTDLLYVVLGTYHTLGLSSVAEAAFDEVHSSNMSKTQADGTILRNADGKVLKGANYVPANLVKFIDNAP